MPLSVAEFEVTFSADSVMTLRLVEKVKELLEELTELEDDEELEVLKLIFTFWSFVIFTLQLYEPSLFLDLLLQPLVLDRAYPLLGVAFKVTVPFLP